MIATGMMGPLQYYKKVKNLFGASLIGYWPLWETSGVVAQDISQSSNNGTYSNCTLAQLGIGDGKSSVGFDGTNSRCSAGATGISFLEGSVHICGALTPAWSENSARRALQINGDASNLIHILHLNTGSKMYIQYKIGGVDKNVTAAFGGTGFFDIFITWSRTNNRFRV
jgi:hypothetical protein